MPPFSCHFSSLLGLFFSKPVHTSYSKWLALVAIRRWGVSISSFFVWVLASGEPSGQGPSLKKRGRSMLFNRGS